MSIVVGVVRSVAIEPSVDDTGPHVGMYVCMYGWMDGWMVLAKIGVNDPLISTSTFSVSSELSRARS